jgi:hypothetical protein
MSLDSPSLIVLLSITDKRKHVARRARKVMGPKSDRQTTEEMHWY